MTDIRIQDFGENSKPDTNNDFVMTFNDNSESKTRLKDAFYSMVPDGMQTHNNIFRGANLGALDSTHIANIQSGSFEVLLILPLTPTPVYSGSSVEVRKIIALTQ